MICFLSGCIAKKDFFGGSLTPETAETVSEGLLSSEDLIFRADGTSVTLTGDRLDSIANLKADGMPTLWPDHVDLGRFWDGWMRFAPMVSGRKFRHTLAEPLAFGEVSVITLVKSSSRGRVLSLDPGDETQQALSLQVADAGLTAKFLSDGSSSFSSTLPLPLGDQAVVGISLPAGATTMDFTVNGVLAPASAISGTPAGAFQLDRVLTFGPDTAGGVTALKEIYVFRRALTKRELGALILTVGDRNALTDIELDPSLSLDGAPADPLFTRAQEILNASCVRCHSSWFNAPASFFVREGLVVRGDAESSRLYYRITGSSGSGGPKNMPVSGSISAADVEALAAWIRAMP